MNQKEFKLTCRINETTRETDEATTVNTTSKKVK
jgi:hypothetical protein